MRKTMTTLSLLAMVAALGLIPNAALARADAEIEESPLFQHIADLSANGMGQTVWKVGQPQVGKA
ncbi:MAG: hypothetical protein ACE5G2_12460, partial [Candidatus Krumholzibacteriia bacterium]